MNLQCMQQGLPTAPLASELMNQQAVAPWIALPRRLFRGSVTAVSAMRELATSEKRDRKVAVCLERK